MTSFRLAVPILAALVLALPVLAQEKAADEDPREEAGAKFAVEFAQVAITGAWLASYDIAAWHSGDEVKKEPPEVMSKLGGWFCYEEDDGWHAVFGRLVDEGKKFERVLHYLVVDPTDVRKLESLESKSFDAPLARALLDSGPRLRATPEARRARFNPYARMTETGVEVWALPQVSGDWVIVGGACFCFRYSASGEEFLERKDWNYGLMGVKADKEKEVLIGHPDNFVYLRFRHLFKDMVIGSKAGRTMLMNGAWVHAMPPSDENEPGESAEETETDDDEGEKAK